MIDQLIAVYTDHGYGKQWWDSKAGYTVVCTCGKEFVVGQIHNQKVLPVAPEELQALYGVQDERPLTGEESARFQVIRTKHSALLNETLKHNREEERQQLRAPIMKHVREEFEKVVSAV